MLQWKVEVFRLRNSGTSQVWNVLNIKKGEFLFCQECASKHCTTASEATPQNLTFLTVSCSKRWGSHISTAGFLFTKCICTWWCIYCKELGVECVASPWPEVRAANAQRWLEAMCGSGTQAAVVWRCHYIYTYNIYTYIHITYIYIYIHIHIYIYILYMYIYIYICIYIYMYVNDACLTHFSQYAPYFTEPEDIHSHLVLLSHRWNPVPDGALQCGTEVRSQRGGHGQKWAPLNVDDDHGCSWALDLGWFGYVRLFFVRLFWFSWVTVDDVGATRMPSVWLWRSGLCRTAKLCRCACWSVLLKAWSPASYGQLWLAMASWRMTGITSMVSMEHHGTIISKPTSTCLDHVGPGEYSSNDGWLTYFIPIFIISIWLWKQLLENHHPLQMIVISSFSRRIPPLSLGSLGGDPWKMVEVWRW